jgi:hypothetical protein
LERVTNLAAIPLPDSAIIASVELARSKLQNLVFVDLQRPFFVALLADVTKPLNIQLPDIERLGSGQWRIVDLPMDS